MVVFGRVVNASRPFFVPKLLTYKNKLDENCKFYIRITQRNESF